MLLTTIIPAIVTVLVSFTNLSIGRRDDWQIIGVDNYTRVLAGADAGKFFGVLGWTLTYALIVTLVSVTIGLLLAVALNDPTVKERAIYRALLILPWALPSVLTAVVWASLLNGSFGPVNQLLNGFGIESVPWLTDPFWARVAVILVSVWMSFPFMMTACLGALQTIPEEVLEAARMDGASAPVVLARIVIPQLSSAVKPLVIAAFAMQVNNFGVIFLLTSGGPAMDATGTPGATDILVTYLYKIAFIGADQNYGLASAVSIILFAIVGGITALSAWALGTTKEVAR
ncbi:MAG TPA: ABC transporter permease subunit [Protaetiibacter sp.]|jgi:arabinogalactan oligomer/maltooligosaccharide transport system permease protein|nr:ABC transporter permease subunit [Protaetiibacter sp.]